MARNVIGEDLAPCSFAPCTGFFRDGYCHTNGDDVGAHTVCAVMTEEFLTFSAAKGNDLSTPHPEMEFPGLKPGDKWCLCLARWIEAHQEGCAPKISLDATHASVLEFVNLDVLQAHAV